MAQGENAELRMVNDYYFSHGKILSLDDSVQFEQLKKDYPKDFLVRMVSGHMEQKKNNFSQAIIEYQISAHLANCKKDSIQAFFSIFHVSYTKQNQDSIALVYADAILGMVPDSCIEMLAGFYVSVLHYDQAVERFEICIEEGRNMASNRLSLISALIHIGDFEKSFSQISNFKNDFPQNFGIDKYLLTVLELEYYLCIKEENRFVELYIEMFDDCLKEYLVPSERSSLDTILNRFSLGNRFVDLESISRVVEIYEEAKFDGENSKESFKKSNYSISPYLIGLLLIGFAFAFAFVLILIRNKKNKQNS